MMWAWFLIRGRDQKFSRAIITKSTPLLDFLDPPLVLVYAAGSDGGLDVKPDGDGCGDPSRDSGEVVAYSVMVKLLMVMKGEFGGGMSMSKSSSSSSKSENSLSEPFMTGSSGSS